MPDTVDFTTRDEGTIWLLAAVSQWATQWGAEHLPDEARQWGASWVIEHRFIADIVQGITDNGGTVHHYA